MSKDPLELLLGDLGHRGRAEHRFTIDPARALAQMSRYQMPAPGLWAVKLVQGAVAAGAHRVTFTLGRGSLEFRCFGDFAANAGDLLGKLVQGRQESDRATAHWIAALRAALGKEPEIMVLTTCQGDQIDQIEIRGGEVRTSRRQLEGSHIYHRLALKVVYGRQAQSRANLAEFQELCQRCRLCPIPVVVDGKDVLRENLPYWTSYLLPSRPEEPDMPLSVQPQSGTESFHLVGDKLLRAGTYRAAMFLGVALSSRPSRPHLYWLRDGALLGPYPTSGPSVAARVDIVLPGDDVDLDLSEWGVKDRARNFPSERVREALVHLARVVSPLEHTRPSAAPGERAIWAGAAAVSLVFGGPGLAGLVVVSGLLGWARTPRNYGAPQVLLTALEQAGEASYQVAEER